MIDDSLRKQIELDKINQEKEELEKTYVAKDKIQSMIADTVKEKIEKLILKLD